MPIKPIDLSRTPKIIENNLNRIAAYEENINNNLTKLKHLEKIISTEKKILIPQTEIIHQSLTTKRDNYISPPFWRLDLQLLNLGAFFFSKIKDFKTSLINSLSSQIEEIEQIKNLILVNSENITPVLDKLNNQIEQITKSEKPIDLKSYQTLLLERLDVQIEETQNIQNKIDPKNPSLKMIKYDIQLIKDTNNTYLEQIKYYQNYNKELKMIKDNVNTSQRSDNLEHDSLPKKVKVSRFAPQNIKSPLSQEEAKKLKKELVELFNECRMETYHLYIAKTAQKVNNDEKKPIDILICSQKELIATYINYCTTPSDQNQYDLEKRYDHFQKMHQTHFQSSEISEEQNNTYNERCIKINNLLAKLKEINPKLKITESQLSPSNNQEQQNNISFSTLG